MSMKNSDDTIGNRVRDRPACSAVPQPTVPPGAPGTIRSSMYTLLQRSTQRQKMLLILSATVCVSPSSPSALLFQRTGVLISP